MEMTATEFIEHLFGDKPSNSYILTWQNPGKVSQWFQSTEEAGQNIEDRRTKPVNTYFGCGLRSKSFGPHGRGKREDIIGIPGLWIDIDIASAKAHKNKALPPTIEDARKLIEGRGWDPTLIVHSGHGIHAWWLFKELWVFEDETERISAEELCQRLQETIRFFAEEQGWGVDATWDLPRVLRPPGSLNHKSDPPVEVTLLDYHGIRYSDPLDMARYFIHEDEHGKTHLPDGRIVDKRVRTTVTAATKAKAIAGLVLAADAEPDPLFLEAAIETDPIMQASWSRTRIDLKDQTASSYHMSIANFCAASGFPRQQIANTLIAWNRKHNEPMTKVLRSEYMALTIAKAIESNGTVENQDPPEEPTPNPVPDGPEPKNKAETIAAAEESAEMMLDRLKQYTGLRIFKITKYVQEAGAQWAMQTAKGDITFKTVGQLTNVQNFKNTIFEALNVYLKIEKKSWPLVINIIGRITTEVDLGEESTLRGRITAWLEAYLADASPINIVQSIAEDDRPFVFNNNWYIYPRRLRQFTWQYYGNTGTQADLTLDLRRVGCTQERFFSPLPSDPNKRTTKRPWKVPSIIVGAPTAGTSDEDDGKPKKTPIVNIDGKTIH